MQLNYEADISYVMFAEPDDVLFISCMRQHCINAIVLKWYLLFMLQEEFRNLCDEIEVISWATLIDFEHTFGLNIISFKFINTRDKCCDL